MFVIKCGCLEGVIDLKKEYKWLVLIYVGAVLFFYLLSLRVEKLESQEDISNRNEAIILRIK